MKDLILFALLIGTLPVLLAGLLSLLTKSPGAAFWKWRRQRNLKLIEKYKGYKPIKLNREKLSNPKLDFPISKDDILELVMKAERTFSFALAGIEEISLEGRGGESYQVFASYMPPSKLRSTTGATIRLYPFERDSGDSSLFRFYLDPAETYYWLMDEQEAKDEILFSLGHEIGHNILYNTERRIKDRDIENECDKISSLIGAVSRQQKFEENKTVYKDGVEIGSIEDYWSAVTTGTRGLVPSPT